MGFLGHVLWRKVEMQKWRGVGNDDADLRNRVSRDQIAWPILEETDEVDVYEPGLVHATSAIHGS